MQRLKMGKSNPTRNSQRYISHSQIITCMCYTILIIGWQRFNYISLLGVMSMEMLNENNESTTSAEVVNLSLASMTSSENRRAEIVPIVTPSTSTTATTAAAAVATATIKRSMEPSKLDLATSNAVDNAPIQGWECYCWNVTTTGYEVKFNL